jgi:hypothetical protein
MSDSQPTSDQLKVLAEVSRIRMAGIMFYFLLVVFLVVLGIFVYAIFWNKGGTIGKIGLGGIDTTVGWSFKHLMTYLFPKKQGDETSIEAPQRAAE